MNTNSTSIYRPGIKLIGTNVFRILLFLVLPLLPAHGQEVWTPDNGDGTFTNPILWGDWPDPDVIRVGDTFYMTSTSMHYVPGCPVLKSKDLVNWEMVSYAVDSYPEDPKYNLQGGSLYLNGSWATSIRYHNGKFYVAFCTPDGWGRKGHFSICEADKPEGPWKRTIFPEYMYDPGLFFDDDGKVYVVHGQGTLYITELDADCKKAKGAPVKVWSTTFTSPTQEGRGFGIEGSHMYKINGKYYITNPCGGTEGWQVCLRSDHIYGPYEYKVIVNDDSSYPGNGLHQGGMVQLKNGDWWFIIMQDRGPIGRVAHLLPVTWKEGWPILGVDGKDVSVYKKPDVGRSYAIKVPATSDEFNGKTLGLQWQWNHNPDPERWSLTERKGFLRLKAGLAPDLKMARNTLTQRVQGPLSTATVELDFSRIQDGDQAGFGIFEFPYAYLAVRQTGTQRELIACHDGQVTDSLTVPAGSHQIWLRARTTDKDFTARLYYSWDGNLFRPFGKVLKMELGLPWTANRFALIHFSTKKEGVNGIADFNWFRMTNK